MSEFKEEINNNSKPYELRKLSGEDMFPMLNIISKIGVRQFKSAFESEDVKNMISNKKDGKVDVVQIGMAVGFDVISIIISEIPSAEKEIFTFLGNLSGMSKKELQNLPLATFTQMIVDVFKKEEFDDFFKAVLTLFS